MKNEKANNNNKTTATYFSKEYDRRFGGDYIALYDEKGNRILNEKNPDINGLVEVVRKSSAIATFTGSSKEVVKGSGLLLKEMPKMTSEELSNTCKAFI